MPSTTTKTVSIDILEQAIRDYAGALFSAADTRIAHPSYGVTKTLLRNRATALDTAIQVYQFADGQALHTHAPVVAVAFYNTETQIVIDAARDKAREAGL